jgi:tRNA pseudouridine13 synthase
VRLIHLYAWQSHLWNRALVAWMRGLLPVEERVVLECEEGPLIAFAGAPPPAVLQRSTLPLPGERLEGVTDPDALRLFEEVLADEDLEPSRMAVDVPGFRLKSEERALLVRPAHLRVRPPEPDNLNPGALAVRVRFELPRGGYATLIVKRLFAEAVGEGREREDLRRGSQARTGERPRRAGGPGRPPWRSGGRGGHGGPHEDRSEP